MKLTKEYLDEVKKQLTIEQIFSLVEHLGGEPKYQNDNVFISRTICHNGAHKGSHKLYYYSNDYIFKCYTGCEDGGVFDAFELVIKVKSFEGANYNLFTAAQFVLSFFGITPQGLENFSDEDTTIADWQILKKYKRKNGSEGNKNVEFAKFDSAFLNNFPRPIIQPWIDEGISPAIMRTRGICYDPVNQGIVIPHYDENGALIGVRERTLIKEEEQFGKYRPAIVNGKMYNHPIGLGLYNFNFSKPAIQQIGKAIVFEGEKSCLKYASLFGEEQDISVATCGSNLARQQVEIMLKYNVGEIIVAFDKQFQELGDDEHKVWVKKLKNIHQKYSPYCKISFMFDKENLLDYKDSPIDKDKEVFLKLFKERIML